MTKCRYCDNIAWNWYYDESGNKIWACEKCKEEYKLSSTWIKLPLFSNYYQTY